MRTELEIPLASLFDAIEVHGIFQANPLRVVPEVLLNEMHIRQVKGPRCTRAG